jgi:hypothetical protein
MVGCSDDKGAGDSPGAGGSAAGAVATSGSSAGGAGNTGVGGTPTGGQSSAGSGQAGSGVAGVAGSGGVNTAGSGGQASGGTSGTSGAGGAGGSAGSAVSAAPTPTAKGYKFAFGDVDFEIDTMVGGRVSKLALGGTDLIVSSGTDPTTWGSVFWTSPRADWTPTTSDWPPPVNIDNAAYTGSVAGTHAVVTGTADSGLGVSMTKDYSVDPTTGWITIAYTINASKALKAAPWEVSRVPRGGIVFFPVDSSLTPGPLTVTQTTGVAWFDDAPKTATSPEGAKCAADGKGWTAYVLGGNLFLKKFTDQPASAQAPDEGEVDVYPGDGFLEFEVQGPYTQIAAAGKLAWSMQWRIVKVPSTVTVAVNSATLLDFVQQQLAL